MKRAALLYCADIDAGKFKVLKQRDQLPFYYRGEDEPGSWADYSLNDAFRMRFMLDLMDDATADGFLTGLGPQIAVSVTESVHNTTIDEAANADVDIWAGVIFFTGVTRDGTAEHWRLRFCQGLSALDAVISSERATWVDAYAEVSPTRMFLANASRAARFVERRADELGVE